MSRLLSPAGAALLVLLLAPVVLGSTVEYDLTVEKAIVNVTGKPVPAMTINGSIPGPVLRFEEGDIARIRVHNRMDEETSIHWHGLLLPFGMDGVPYLNFPPIAAGATFTYEFPLRQSGTYWYHSHSGLQEQVGVYGAIVIEPAGPSQAAHHAGHGHAGHSDREHVVLFSDWTDENPREVLRTLKRGSHWYALEKGSGQSLFGAARAGRLKPFLLGELQRMPPMDISDVAYDRFLANGRPETTLEASQGELVRLRLINGSSSTYFHLEFAGGEMTIVASDGLDIEPIREKRLLVAVAETYDVLVRIPEGGSYELRATAHDGSSYASAWLGSGARHPAPEVPRPDLYGGHGDHGTGSLFALTPAGVVGMPDSRVAAGEFDKPGPAMGGHTKDHGAGHGAGRSMNHGGAGHELSHSPDGIHDHRPEPADHQGHAMPVENGHVSHEATDDQGSPPPSGRRYGKRFGLLDT
jgi:CopA family copper-resistance protein